MITLEDCNCGLRQAQADSSGLTTMEKIYFMARGQPVDLVEGEDGVWSVEPPRSQYRNEGRYSYGHVGDCFDYFTKYAGVNWPDCSGIWLDRSIV